MQAIVLSIQLNVYSIEDIINKNHTIAFKIHTLKPFTSILVSHRNELINSLSNYANWLLYNGNVHFKWCKIHKPRRITSI